MAITIRLLAMNIPHLAVQILFGGTPRSRGYSGLRTVFFIRQRSQHHPDPAQAQPPAPPRAQDLPGVGRVLAITTRVLAITIRVLATTIRVLAITIRVLAKIIEFRMDAYRSFAPGGLTSPCS